MKPLPIICLALVFATPAFAAPQSVEDACWRYAQRVTPYLTEREKEAYIANCIADWTAGTPPSTRTTCRRSTVRPSSTPPTTTDAGTTRGRSKPRSAARYFRSAIKVGKLKP